MRLDDPQHQPAATTASNAFLPFSSTAIPAAEARASGGGDHAERARQLRPW
jgi:hypothetical protein